MSRNTRRTRSRYHDARSLARRLRDPYEDLVVRTHPHNDSAAACRARTDGVGARSLTKTRSRRSSRVVAGPQQPGPTPRAEEWAGTKAHNRWMADLRRRTGGGRHGPDHAPRPKLGREIRGRQAAGPNRRCHHPGGATRLRRPASLRPPTRPIWSVRGPALRSPPQRQRRPDDGDYPAPSRSSCSRYRVGPPRSGTSSCRRHGEPPDCSSSAPSRAGLAPETERTRI